MLVADGCRAKTSLTEPDFIKIDLLIKFSFLKK
jgi:hypothetical protein